MIKRIFKKLFTEEVKTVEIDVRPFLALIEALGMLAENKWRELKGESLAYGEEDFYKLADKYGIRRAK